MTDQTDLNVLLMLIAGTMGMLLLAISMILFIIYYQKRLLKQQLQIQEMETAAQRDLLNATLQTQENERRRISRDLHDHIGAMLSTIKLSIGQMGRKMTKEDSSEGLAKDTKDMMDEIITHVRKLSHDLMPATLENFGMADAFDELAAKLKMSEELDMEFTAVSEIPRIDSKIELAMYRMVQEFVNNTIKHANASKIDLYLQYSGNHLLLEIEDNGDGFDIENVKQRPSKQRGLGLYNIESRAGTLPGKVAFNSAFGVGTKMTIHLELN